GPEHPQGGPVLHAAAWVEPFRLREQLDPRRPLRRDALQREEGRVTDQVRQTRGPWRLPFRAHAVRGPHTPTSVLFPRASFSTFNGSSAHLSRAALRGIPRAFRIASRSRASASRTALPLTIVVSIEALAWLIA